MFVSLACLFIHYSGYYCPLGSGPEICPAGYGVMSLSDMYGFMLHCYILIRDCMKQILLFSIINCTQRSNSMSSRHLGLDDGTGMYGVFGSVHCRYGGCAIKKFNF